MKDNEAYIICIKTPNDCYLGHDDIVVTRMRSAKLYHDNMYAQSELNRVLNKYSNLQHFQDLEKLSIKKVEINFVND